MPSSVVTRIHYDAKSEQLRIMYTSGAVYDYEHVPEEVYAAMMQATSKGTFLNTHIKDKYPYRKIA